ncbi:MAG: TIGR00159 family protein [Deltaproteobacteria bacterium]|nr:TIGR00159 family protein [Deltaproteobacteria bacterium]
MLNVLHSLRWQDIVDILIVAFIIYRIILLIRGTRAVQMLAGIGVLVIVYFGARELELMTLYWLLGTLLSSIFLLMVIVFQQDIRRALTQMGQAAPFTMQQGNADLDIGQLVTAAHNLSRQKIGAIIVIERETGLKDYLESSHPIDAILSHELLISIFKNVSPLHDGGVVISRGRIHSARCVLPLTRNPYVPKVLGTRHRAALGISEETDAVVLVVSEETGKISLVQRGSITAGLDKDTLHNHLKALFISGEHQPLTWKNWLKKI